MRVAISGDEGFIAHYLKEELGDECQILTPDILADEDMLPAILASCNAIVHLNGHSPDQSLERSDQEVLRLMRDEARVILKNVQSHQGIHLVLVGSLRVHPNPRKEDEYYSSESPLSPRDIAAEGQLWVEESALEHAMDTHPVSIIRTANVQGISPAENKGHGVVHHLCREAMFGFFNVPGTGEEVKDVIHVKDLASMIKSILDNPPPTRGAVAVGRGQGVRMSELAEIVSQATGASPQYNSQPGGEVWGIVDGWEMGQRIEHKPEVSIQEIIEEALSNQ
jgi:nucleoside-diphosphate-sugar epimerase